MEMLSVRSLNKTYEKFRLKDVSFSLDAGYIMGFIGRNGAGKTTTLKAMLHLIHPESGAVTILGRDYQTSSLALKQQIGFMSGGVDFYPKQKLSLITRVVKRFYDGWDDAAYRGYLERFGLDESKKVEELSQGMKVKYGLALALSHQARLLILDEPTSGLDPVSRDDLLELFQQLIEDGGKSILFSTQITSDLDKCADYITYIKDGEIMASTSKDDFLGAYKIIKGAPDLLTPGLSSRMVGCKKNAYGFSGLIKVQDLPEDPSLDVSAPDIESIMIYFEKGCAQ
jgi:ABC-2 type transport system ATP-binding protein